MTIRLPRRLRHHTRILSIQCGRCGHWRKPRHIRIPAMICRTCETNPAVRTWHAYTTYQQADHHRHLARIR